LDHTEIVLLHASHVNSRQTIEQFTVRDPEEEVLRNSDSIQEMSSLRDEPSPNGNEGHEGHQSIVYPVDSVRTSQPSINFPVESPRESYPSINFPGDSPAQGRLLIEDGSAIEKPVRMNNRRIY
jgi:hypothetical protein